MRNIRGKKSNKRRRRRKKGWIYVKNLQKEKSEKSEKM
jgi:hypothetical protein